MVDVSQSLAEQEEAMTRDVQLQSLPLAIRKLAISTQPSQRILPDCQTSRRSADDALWAAYKALKQDLPKLDYDFSAETEEFPKPPSSKGRVYQPSETTSTTDRSAFEATTSETGLYFSQPRVLMLAWSANRTQ